MTTDDSLPPGQVNFTMRHPDVPENECYCNAERGVKCLNCVHAGIVEKARFEERDRIVEWLRESGQSSFAARNAFPAFHVDSIATGERIYCNTPVDIDTVADAIEAGEHREAAR